MTTMKWQTTIPTREQIEAHRARGGAWMVLNPVLSPFGGQWLWPGPKFATFDESEGA